MTSIREFTMNDLLRFNSINLDELTETYNMPFYMSYLSLWPESFLGMLWICGADILSLHLEIFSLLQNSIRFVCFYSGRGAGWGIDGVCYRKSRGRGSVVAWPRISCDCISRVSSSRPRPESHGSV